MDKEKRTTWFDNIHTGTILITGIATTLITIFFSSHVYYHPNIVYSEGKYYESPSGFTTQILLKNIGHATANKIILKVSFSSRIIDIQGGDAQWKESDIESSSNPQKSAIISIPRMVEGKQRTFFITIEKRQDISSVEFLEFDEGAGKPASEPDILGWVYRSIIFFVLGLTYAFFLGRRQQDKIFNRMIDDALEKRSKE